LVKHIRFAFSFWKVFNMQVADWLSMSSIDYGAIALITIFTSFFAGFGQELAKVCINYIRKWHQRVKAIKAS
jgi:hypothetical protein